MLDHLRRKIALAALSCIAVSGTLATSATVATLEASPAFAEPTSPEPENWILVDAGTGNVLQGRDVYAPKRTASVVKVMTALAAVERLPLSATATITADEVAKGNQNREASGLAAGQSWSLDQLLHVLLINSANDAAYAIAHETSGTTAKFVEAQQATAARLGMKNSEFNDPSGLDDESSYGGGPRMSAYDIAIATRAALGVPELAAIAKTSRYKYTDPAGVSRTVVNHNQLLAQGRFPYPDATGFKTGFTRRAGDTLTATATRKGRTLIAVVLNTADTFGWAARLLDAGFAMPVGSTGTGERLPPNRFTTVAQRVELQQDFALLVAAPGVAAPGSSVPTSNQGSVTSGVVTSSAATTTSKAAPATTARTSQASASSGGKNDDSSATPIVVSMLAILIIAFVARREQIKRRRAKRRARQRSTQAALRRGSLPVVDGRYRPGMRTGPPVQSNVKLRRNDDD